MARRTNRRMVTQRTDGIPGVFLYYEDALKEGGGGVQICSREYYKSLEAAGFSLTCLQVKNDMRAVTRIRRRLQPRSYRHAFVANKVMRDVERALADGCEWIFLNQARLRPLARMLKEAFGDRVKSVLLSHGLQSVDYLHELRWQSGSRFQSTPRRDMLTLARFLAEECEQSRFLDHVFCLAPFEVEIERWLGARKVTYLPRVIDTQPLTWKPQYHRMGFVGTLDHPPNREGLDLFLTALERRAGHRVYVRVVGGPVKHGEAIARRFPMVQYLGPLDDDALRAEASTWNCFLHPIFCYAMGCSTKLAIAISWEVPIATTTAGCRGYTWSDGTMPLAETPDDFAHLVLSLTEPNRAQSAQREISRIRRSSPTNADVARLIQDALCPTKAWSRARAG